MNACHCVTPTMERGWRSEPEVGGGGSILCVPENTSYWAHVLGCCNHCAHQEFQPTRNTEMIFHWVRFLKIPGLSSLVILVIHGNLSWLFPICRHTIYQASGKGMRTGPLSTTSCLQCLCQHKRRNPNGFCRISMDLVEICLLSCSASGWYLI